MTTSNATIVEVAPRDGLQNDPADLSTDNKVRLVAKAAAAGIGRIEVTSFVGARAVPKMADAEAVVRKVKATVRDVSIIGLVVNRRGVERAAEAGVDEVNVVVAASDTFNLRNQSVPTGRSLSQLPELLTAARVAGLSVSVTIATSFGCPFEGEVPVSRLVDVAAAVAAAGADEIALADTIGVAVPTDVTERFAAIGQAVGAAFRLRAHFHNTRNTATANAVAALSAGVTTLDASLGGIGGCPFAPLATGNLATEDLVYLLDRMGISTGVSLERLLEGSRWLTETLGHPVSSLVSKAGGFWATGGRGSLQGC